jgi:hypothetical protein
VIPFFLIRQMVEEKGNDGEAVNGTEYSDKEDEGNAHIMRRISQRVVSLDL